MKKIFLLIIVLIAVTPIVSKAQEYTLLEPLPCIPGTSTGKDCGTTPTISIDSYIGYVFKFSIALAVFLAVLMIIWGGIQYMTSEAPFLKIEGKNKIGGALLGLLLTFASYLILATIDPRLVEINTNVPPIDIDTSGISKFKTDIYNDLNNFSLEAQRENSNLNDKILSDKEELEKLNLSIENDGDILTPEEMEALIVKKTKLEQSIKASESKKIDIATNAYVNTVFKNALDVFHNSISYESKTLVFATGPTVEVNETAKTTLNEYRGIIMDSFEKSIQKLDETADYELVQKLKKDRAFYMQQIDKEEEANVLINKYILNKGGTKAELEQAVKTYQEQLKTVVTATSDTTMAEKYRLILQDRINRTTAYITK
mgnify:CR=1 FL=1